jgi:hypothetical protein
MDVMMKMHQVGERYGVIQRYDNEDMGNGKCACQLDGLITLKDDWASTIVARRGRDRSTDDRRTKTLLHREKDTIIQQLRYRC